MKSGVLAKSFLMGIVCPLIIYLLAAVFDVITQESNASLNVMFIEGLCLFFLPMFFLGKEKKLNRQFPTKLIAPAYLSGYAVIAAVMIFVTDSIDMEKLFGHQFLGGIGLAIMLIILACGFGWAVIFRIIAAIVRYVQKK